MGVPGSSVYTVQGDLYRGTSHANAYANVLNNYSAGRTPAYFRAADTGGYLKHTQEKVQWCSRTIA